MTDDHKYPLTPGRRAELLRKRNLADFVDDNAAEVSSALVEEATKELFDNIYTGKEEAALQSMKKLEGYLRENAYLTMQDGEGTPTAVAAAYQSGQDELGQKLADMRHEAFERANADRSTKGHSR